jgi:His/Glu/Gln/Arg/opine family amino acid ABC transporter permease subunit
VLTLFNPSLLWANRGEFLSGAAVGLALGTLAAALALLFGLLGWSLKASRRPAMRWVGYAYVESMRNTPVLLYIYLFYFGLAEIGLSLSPFNCALLALSVQSGAYMTEVIRGAFTAVGEEQRQAARALALRPWNSVFYVELPQVLRVAFPALGNQVVSLLLGTSLASVITVPELTYQSQIVGDRTYQYFSVFALDAFLYVVIVQMVNTLWSLIERRLFGGWGVSV